MREASAISGRLATNQIAERETVFFYPLSIYSTWRDFVLLCAEGSIDDQRSMFPIATTLHNYKGRITLFVRLELTLLFES